MSVIIREATESDTPTLEIIRRQAIEAEYAERYDRSAYASLVAAPDPDLPNDIESNDATVLVAASVATPVGYLTFDQSNSELQDIYTAPDYARRGYGSRLLERLEVELDGTSVDAIHAWAPEHLEAFFLANGFEPTGETALRHVPCLRVEK